MRSYAWRDLVRNPRRTLATLAGLTLGVGLFASVLFFVDASGATMTKRAIAPLSLDLQSVLTSPPGGGLSLEERVSAKSPLAAGSRALVALTVRNRGTAPANEVVVNDEPPQPLTYVRGTAKLNGKALRDVGGQSPLEGFGGTGLNIGTVRPGATVALTYVVRAARTVNRVAALELRGKVSSREDILPAAANAPLAPTLEELQARAARVPGVASADALSFVDLSPGSLRARGRAVDGIVRVFAFDRAYQQHYPSIRVTGGSFAPRAALLSAEASAELSAGIGARVELRLPGGGQSLALPVSGLVDLTQAKPLFSSRKARKFEDFLYVPNSIVVSPATFERSIIPALRAGTAVTGTVTKTFAVREVDVLVDRSRLRADPAAALAQTRPIAGALRRLAPGQGFVIDNISNTLEVARDDAAVGKRMFVFLGLPGIVLAALFAAYTGGLLARAQRREHAILRVRGADRGSLQRLLAWRTASLAGVSSVTGVVLGGAVVLLIVGADALFEAEAKDLAKSALVSLGMGLLTTSAGLYLPGERALRREVSDERAELQPATAGRRRWQVGAGLLAAAALAEAIAFGTGAFDTPRGSVSAGVAVSLPSYLVLPPLVAWLGGVLLCAGLFLAVTSRVPLPDPSHFGPVLRGTLTRGLRRRGEPLANGVLGIGLVFASGVSIAMFGATYDAAKAADSRFVVGSDLRVTPGPTSIAAHSPAFASRLLVPGVSSATPVVFTLENSVLIGRFNRRTTDLAAIDPSSFERTASLGDSQFVDRSAADALAALRSDPRGLLVAATVADDLSIEPGDSVRVVLARGTTHEAPGVFHVLALFEGVPGFAGHVDLVANLRFYESATGSKTANFFLVRTRNHTRHGLAGAIARLRAGPGSRQALAVDSTRTILDKDQSSLTALDIRGLVDVAGVFTLLMSATGIALFVFGVILQRRREYVTLRALGMRARDVQALVLAEAALVAAAGVVAGVLVGTGTAYLLVHVLRPLFLLEPRLTFPVADVAVLAVLALAATIASALLASAALRRLRPIELLRDL